MTASHDSIRYGYDEFFHSYFSVPWHQGLVDSSSFKLPHPSEFSVHNPRHCCLLAVHGFVIFPHGEQSIKDAVKDGGPYHKTVLARMKLFEETVDEFNALQEKMKSLTGGKVTITIDDGPVLDGMSLAPFGGELIEQAAPQYEFDRKFLKFGTSARLNHFAQGYKFSNHEALCKFLAVLDSESRELGFQSYSAICTPSRFLKDLKLKWQTEVEMKDLLTSLNEKESLLQRESVFTIDRFVACRISTERKPYFVDVSSEGVHITLRDGIAESSGIVSSKFFSERSPEFHRHHFGLG